VLAIVPLALTVNPLLLTVHPLEHFVHRGCSDSVDFSKNSRRSSTVTVQS
jgi:hypothetical protein